MKKTIIILLAALALAACSDKLGGRIDQLADVPVPGKVTVTDIRSITGGAVIKVAIPDDEEETEDPDGTEQPENASEETPEDGTEERQENIVDEDVPEEENDL